MGWGATPKNSLSTTVVWLAFLSSSASKIIQIWLIMVYTQNRWIPANRASGEDMIGSFGLRTPGQQL